MVKVDGVSMTIEEAGEKVFQILDWVPYELQYIYKTKVYRAI